MYPNSVVSTLSKCQHFRLYSLYKAFIEYLSATVWRHVSREDELDQDDPLHRQASEELVCYRWHSDNSRQRLHTSAKPSPHSVAKITHTHTQNTVIAKTNDKTFS